MKKFAEKLDKFFKISESGSSISTEIIAGLTTFFAMCYIVVVNPSSMISGVHAGLQNAVFVGGIVAAVVATLLMAFVAKKPFALAAGMGLNSFFFVTFILPYVLGDKLDEVTDGFAAGLACILISGLVFLVLSVTGVRKLLAQALPKTLKVAIPAGIGGFIAFIGFQNSGLVEANQYTLVQFCDFTSWANCAPAIVAFVGFILIVVFASSKHNFFKKGAVILGILAATALYYIFSIFTPSLQITASSQSLGQIFKDWFAYGFSAFKGFGTLFNGTLLGSVFSAIMIVITFCLVDMFDTLGTVYGAAQSVGMVDENGDPENLGEIMLCDSIGTVAGALTGTSTITTYVESSAGIGAGGRTGLASVVTGGLFLLCLLLGPIVNYVPSAATAAALIYVGVLMFKGARNVNWDDPRAAATAFMTITMMICTYSITNGIMIGAMTYTLFTICTRKFEKKDIVVSIIALLGLLRFIFVAM